MMVLRTGKWDIPASLAQNPVQGVDLSYIVIEDSAGVPWTLDRAYPFVSGSDVVMGFPDILIRPTTLYRQMVEELRAGRSDVVLGVMPTGNPSKVDVVEITDDGKVDCIRPKPDGLSTARAWIAAAWRPSFTEYIHDFLVNNPVGSATERELYLGDILAASLTELDVFAVVCDEGRFIDIGTPEVRTFNRHVMCPLFGVERGICSQLYFGVRHLSMKHVWIAIVPLNLGQAFDL